RRAGPHRERSRQRQERQRGGDSRQRDLLRAQGPRGDGYQGHRGGANERLPHQQRREQRQAERTRQRQQQRGPQHVQEVGIAFDPSFQGRVDESPAAQQIARVDQRDGFVVDEEIEERRRVGGKDEAGGRGQDGDPTQVKPAQRAQW